MHSINISSVAPSICYWLYLIWFWCKEKNKSFGSRGWMWTVLENQQLPQTTRWWLWLWAHITSFLVGTKHIYPHTDSTHTSRVTVTSYPHALNTWPQAHTQTGHHTTPHTHTHIHASTCTCTHTHIHAHTRVHARKHTHTYADSLTHSSEIWGPFWQLPSWLGIGQTRVIQEKQSRPTRGLGLLCLWSVTLHHEGNP